MSSPSSDGLALGSKLHIDARAAELKERLLKSRTQRSRDSSLTPARERNLTGAGPDKQPPASKPHSATSPFVPHPMPKPPLENSVPADANDIAAFISSISSASHGEEGKISSPAKPAAPSPIARQSQSSQSPCPQPSMGPTTKAIADAKTEAKAESDNAAAPSFRPVKLHRGTTPLEEGEITSDSTKNGRKTSASEQQQQPPQSSPRQVPTTTRKGSATFSPMTNESKAARPAERQSILSTASPAVHSRDAASMLHANHSEPRELVPSSTYYRTSALSGSQDMGNEPVTNPDEHRRGENGNNNIEPVSSKYDSTEQLATLLERDNDLRDWLTLTQYFDVEARRRKLTRYRKLAEIDAEQKRMQAEQRRIDAERQKLLAEEESERGMAWPVSTPTPLQTSTSLPPNLVLSGQNNGNGASAPNKSDSELADAIPQSITNASLAYKPSIPAKREPDSTGNDEVTPRSTKLPRLDGHSPRAENGAGKDIGRDNRAACTKGQEYKPHEFPGRDQSPRRRGSRNSLPSSSRGEYRGMSPSYQREPSPHRRPISPGYHPRGGYTRYGNYRGDSGRPVYQRSPSPMGRRDYSLPRYPRHVDLGYNGG